MSETLSVTPALVASVAFALGGLFGVASNRTRFCTLGALSDIVLFGSWARMRLWLLAMAVAVVGAGVLQGVGWLTVADTLYASPRLNWVSHVCGGLLFGAGMVLASGCGARTLTRLGSGSLKALVVALALGLTAYMTMRGILAPLRVGVFDRFVLELPAGQDLPALLAAWQGAPGRGPWLAGLTLLGGGGLFLAALWRNPDEPRRLLWAAFGIGGVCVAGWLLTGHVAYVAEHPLTLEPAYVGTNSGRAESLTFVAPFAHALDLLLFWTDTARFISFGVACAAGVVVGACVQALLSRNFRFEGFVDTADLVRHVAGGMLMGFGGVTALGCTIGQGISGVSVLSLGSFLTLAGICLGALLVLHIELRRSSTQEAGG